MTKVTQWTPKQVDGLTLMFGPSRIADYLPAMKDIPDEFKNDSNPWVQIISGWFFKGLKKVPAAKSGVDHNAALRHVACCMKSFEPKHEHKEAGCAYLMSLWFELPKQ